jgi:hypothetical protein
VARWNATGVTTEACATEAYAARAGVDARRTAVSSDALARFVHGEAPALQFRVVQILDDRLHGLGRFHLDESESARPSGLAVHDQGHGLDLAVFGEQLADLLLGCTEGKVSYVDFLSHFLASMVAFRPTRLMNPSNPRRLTELGHASV